MRNRSIAVVVCVLLLSLSVFAAPKTTGKVAGSAPDKAYLQKIWDGWASLNAEGQGQYYAQGPHTFFDVAPLKYASWDQYQAGVSKELEDFKSAAFTLNDDLAIHPHGDLAWVTSTIKMDATMKDNKRAMATFRWTVVFEKQNGKWLIVHEHVSQPAQ